MSVEFFSNENKSINPFLLTPLAVVAETVTVQAAGPQTVKVKLDKKTGKRYGYDENNQKVTQQWGVTAKGFRYYFGKNGAAYQADQDMVGKYRSPFRYLA